MTPEQLQAATGCRIIAAAKYAQPLTEAMDKYGITTLNRKAAFVANCAHESGLFTILCEDLHYSTAQRLMLIYPSAFRTIESTQGYLMNPTALAKKVYGGYLGRGLIQLTWLKNYQAYATASGVDVVSTPDLLLEAKYAADSAGWYWGSNNLNAAADKSDWAAVTRGINGRAMLGHAERVALIQRALKAFI